MGKGYYTSKENGDTGSNLRVEVEGRPLVAPIDNEEGAKGAGTWRRAEGEGSVESVEMSSKRKEGF